jgi:hypothetical protein
MVAPQFEQRIAGSRFRLSEGEITGGDEEPNLWSGPRMLHGKSRIGHAVCNTIREITEEFAGEAR